MAVDARRVQEVFSAALEVADFAQQAALLDQECAADPELRRRVEALFRAHRKAASILDQPAVAPCETTWTSIAGMHPLAGTDASQTTEGYLDLGFLEPATQPGALGRIGHYEVFEVLGRGGFGIVLRAIDDTLRRMVAVKVLAPHLAATSPARNRFLREARSYAAIRHENVVQVHAVDAHPIPHLVMEFLPGETLQRMIDRIGPLDVATILSIGRQIAAGLAAAHQIGLIHRDVKPANVLVEGATTKRVKLTDFGLARAADDASVSQSGLVAGTPLYMAPEQARGATLDHRADLFSLGSVLYVMCTGRPPFRASSTAAILRRVCDDLPRPIREIIPETPSWLCDVVTRLHAKDPSERFHTAGQVADLLERYEGELTTHGEVVSAPRRRKRSRVVPFVGIVAGALCCAAVMVLAWFFRFGASQPPNPLERGTAVAADNARPELAAAVDHTIARISRPDHTSWFADDLGGKWLAVGCETEVVLFDLRTMVPAKVIGPAAESIYQLAFSADGKQLATASRTENDGEDSAVVWSVETGKPSLRLKQKGNCPAIKFSPDGGCLLTVGKDHVPTLWDARTGVKLHCFPAQDEPVCYDVTFTPDGRNIVTHGSAGDVKVWDARTWTEVVTLSGPGQITEDPALWTHLPLAVSGDGKWLAAGSESGFRIWATHGWTEEVSGNTPATWLAFASDGRVLLTGAHDCTDGRWHEVSRWNTRTGERLATASLGSRGGWAIFHLSADGKKLYSMTADPAEAMVHVYDADTLKEQFLKAPAGRLFNVP
jgi:hypothetical protein